MDNKLDEKQSLEVITGMIAQAQNHIQKGSGRYFLLWGYIISLAAIAQFVWLYYDLAKAVDYSNLIWGVAFTAGLLGTLILILLQRKSNKPFVKTYTGSVGNAVWGGFCVCTLLISLLLGGENGVYISPAISLVYTYACFIFARLFRFRWMYWCVLLCALLVVLYKFVPFIWYPILMAAILIVGNIIPGHIINYKARNRVR